MIHQYIKRNNNIVLDVGSGCVHLVDEITYNIISLLKDKTIIFKKIDDGTKRILENFYDIGDIESSYNEIYSLYQNKKLFVDDNYKNNIQTSTISPIKAVCLHVAHDCNLRCKYCFASTGDYEGNRGLMSEEIGKMAIDFLVKNSQNRVNLEVDFFGGEPLMNFNVVKKIVEYSRTLEKKHNKNFRFTMTTNGVTLSNEVIEYLDENMHNIVLSIDGRKKVNDEMRLTINQKGSYDIIIDNIKEMVKKRENRQYYIRGTFTKNNLDFSNDVLDLYNQGFKAISMEPVIIDSGQAFALLESDIPLIKKEYDRLADKILKINEKKKNLNFFHFNMDLTGGPCILKRIKGCGAGSEYIAVTPEGDIYPCHQFVGDKEWIMGNLTENTFDNNMKTEFSSFNIYTKDNCEKCWAKFYCSGGCLANSWQYVGDISKTHRFSCELEKARIETSILLKVEEARKSINIEDNNNQFS